MRVGFRCDASPTIGIGHLARCLAVAERLAGAEVAFVCRDLPGHRGGDAAARGHALHLLPAALAGEDDDADRTIAALGPGWDWLVVDHYGLTERWERRVRQVARRILVIDDLADRRHDCDLLVDHNLHRDAEARYAGLVPAGCRLLCGPRWALIRGGFAAERARLRRRDGSVRRLHVCFGGSDPTGETEAALDALADPRLAGLEVDVVVGPANPRRDAIAARCAAAGWRCLIDPPDLAALVAAADLAIGAGGVSTWERCTVGLPSLVIAVADNQVALSEAAAAAGASIYLGRSGEVAAAALADAVAAAIADPARLRAVSAAALAVTRRGPDDPELPELLEQLLAG